MIHHANCAPKAAKSRCPPSGSKCKYKVLKPGLQWRAEQSALRAAAAAASLVAPPSVTCLRAALEGGQASAIGATKTPTHLMLSKSRILTEQDLKEGVLNRFLSPSVLDPKSQSRNQKSNRVLCTKSNRVSCKQHTYDPIHATTIYDVQDHNR